MPPSGIRFFLFLLALVLLPFISALGVIVWDLLFLGTAEVGVFTPPQWAFVGGFIAWVVIYILTGKTSIFYIWAHELTHAFTGLLFGAKIHRISINRSGGFVELSKSNLLITLSPYFIPFYLLILLFIGFLLRKLLPQVQLPETVWFFGIGFTFSFHILHTVNALLTVAQPDIRVYGRLFSYWFILFMNLIFIFGGLLIFYGIPLRTAFFLFTNTLQIHYTAVIQVVKTFSSNLIPV